jgi:hypothetical protein
MMMQMLRAGGMPILCDEERKADTDNPKGYFEWERIKELGAHPEWIREAEGKAVKVFSPFMPSLPAGHEYKIVFMRRPLLEVLKSQNEMLRRSEQPPKPDDSAALPGFNLTTLEEAFRWHLTATEDWQSARVNMHALRVDYHSVLRESTVVAREITVFLGLELDAEAMARQVDPRLYRNREAA